MLLRVNRPLYAKGLACATYLVGEILNLAAEIDGTSIDEGTLGQQVLAAQAVTQFDSFLDALTELMKRTSKNQRAALRRAYWNDVSFFAHRNDDEFAFLFCSLDEDVRAVAKDFFSILYGNILSSKTGFVGLPWRPTVKLNRHSLEASFRSANGYTANLCPVCLEETLPPIDETSQVDCDHFLPLHRYPPLAVHPDNLVFTCVLCNERRKRATDPLEALDPLEGAKLPDSFLPYDRPAVDEIEPDFLVDGAPVQFRVKQPATPRAVVRLGHLERLYKVSDVYSAKLRYHVYKSTMKAVCLSAGKAKDRRRIAKGLRDVAAMDGVEDYLISSFAQWVLNNAFDSFAAEYEIFLRAGVQRDVMLLRADVNHETTERTPP